ncbi:ParA family protein [Streptomyces sp. NPDC088731]|uniref:ParA family protein n=1 Tax=Streptomyces sp. NPDC088731 TaxID=3365878 RepID=UPI00381636CC
MTETANDTTARLAIPSQQAERLFLEIVADYDTELPYQEWRAQVRLPDTFGAARPRRTVVVANQKGGAGKTTSAMELAAAWVAMGYRVRVWDADPQKAALTAVTVPLWPEGVDPRDLKTLSTLFLAPGTTLADVTYETRFEGLTIVPSLADLGTVEKTEIMGGQLLIRQAIEADRRTRPEEAPDVEVIDSGPTLGLLTMAALGAAEDVVVPVVAGGLDFIGMQDLDMTLTTARERLNPNFRVAAVLMTEWAKSGVQRTVTETLAADYPDAIVSPIRRSPKVREAPFEAMPTRVYAPRDKAVADFAQVASLMINRKG